VAASTKSGLPTTTILGIVLGSIFGTAAILILILLLLKKRQQRQSFIESGHTRRASGQPEEKDFFRDDVASTSGGYFRGHNQQESQSSFSSMAMFLGKGQKPAIQRNGSNEKKRISSRGSVYGQDLKSTISRPRPQPQLSAQPMAFLAQDEKPILPPVPAEPKPRTRPTANQDQDELRRSSGWNRYWSGGSTSIMGFGNNSKSRRDTEVSDQSSQYSDMRHRMTQDSATVPPLQVNIEGRPSFLRVNSGSPTVSQYDSKIKEGMSGQIERPVSAVSAVSSSGYSSGIPPSVHEAWDPTMPKKPWGANRAPSSTYSQSTISENFYPTGLGAPSANRPVMGMSTQPRLPIASSMTTDMSWLNLGNNDNNGRPYR
jgi:hypothetical protein